MFLLLFILSSFQAIPTLATELVYIYNQPAVFLKETKLFRLKVDFSVLAADQKSTEGGTGPCERSVYKRGQRVSRDQLDRVVRLVEREVEPRILSLMERYQLQALGGAFPIELALNPGISPLCAASSDAGISIGDLFSPTQELGWQQTLVHEVGHQFARAAKMSNPYYDEFWADFVAWAAFDFDPRLTRGFDAVKVKYARGAYPGNDPLMSLLRDQMISLMGEDSLRDLSRPADLSLVIRVPFSYTVSTHLLRFLISSGVSLDRLAARLFGMLVSKGENFSLETANFLKEVLHPLNPSAQAIGALRQIETVPSLLDYSGMLSLNKNKIRMHGEVEGWNLSVKPDSSVFRTLGPTGILFLGLSDESHHISTMVLTSGAEENLKFFVSRDCEKRLFHWPLASLNNLEFSAYSWEQGRASKQTFDLKLILAALAKKKLARGHCWVVGN